MEVPTITKYVSELTPHPDNYNSHPKGQIAQLAESLTTFGQFKNIVAWTCPTTMTTPEGVELHEGLCYILAGHGLWLAAMEAGFDELEVKDYSGLSYEMALSLLMIDNAAPQGSEPIVAKLLANLERTREAMAATPRLAEMLAELKARAGVNGKAETKDAPAQIDKAAQLAEIWGTRVGQIWQLGAHRLAVGDCTDKEVVNAVAFGERINFIYVDPPYSVAYADKNASLNAVAFGNRIQTPIENDHLGVEETAKTIWKPAFTNLFDLALPGCAYYCSAPQGGDQMMMMMMLCESGWLVKHEIIWVKNNHVLGRADYQYKHEPIIYGWKPGAGHYFIDSRSEFSVWEIDKPHNSDYHPTTKPLELVERAMSNSSKTGDICADFFVGSGTTILAGENLGRKVRAIELDPGYAAVTLQRFFDATGIEPKLT